MRAHEPSDTAAMGHSEQEPIVLIIDDEPSICELFARALATSGFFPVTAPTAEVALRLIDGGLQPDAILLDLVMPGMGGLGFLLQIRGNPNRNGIPVAIVTGDAVIPTALERAASALDAEIHLKPLEIEAVLALTERLVESGSEYRLTIRDGTAHPPGTVGCTGRPTRSSAAKPAGRTEAHHSQRPGSKGARWGTLR